jgi:hypothetical protein
VHHEHLHATQQQNAPIATQQRNVKNDPCLVDCYFRMEREAEADSSLWGIDQWEELVDDEAAEDVIFLYP